MNRKEQQRLGRAVEAVRLAHSLHAASLEKREAAILEESTAVWVVRGAEGELHSLIYPRDSDQ
jgi:hypothetical protein